MAFDSELLTPEERCMLAPDPRPELERLFEPRATPFEAFATICTLRAALLQIAELPASRCVDGPLIAFHALESFLMAKEAA